MISLACWLLCACAAPAQAPFAQPPAQGGDAQPPKFAPPTAVDNERIAYPPERIQRTAGQVPGRATTLEDEIDFRVRTELPDLRDLTRRDSEKDLFERIRLESRQRPGGRGVYFPEEPVLSTETYVGRNFCKRWELVEPAYVCHNRLYFEQPNWERSGWDFGPLQPGICLGVFYYDLAMLPYHMWTRPCEKYDCNVGKAWPGQPTPLYLYREPFSVTGLAAEAGVIVGGFYIAP